MGTIFVAGTYGVGKSTLCNKLSTALKIPDFSAGDLISAVNGETYGANKVVRDKDANQNILASQVKQLLKSTPNIILAGHFCIFDINGNVDTLPSRVFYDLEIETILLLEASSLQIIKNILRLLQQSLWWMKLLAIFILRRNCLVSVRIEVSFLPKN